MDNTDKILKIAKQFIAIQSTHSNPKGLEEGIEFIEGYLKNFKPSINFKTFKENDKPSLIAYNSMTVPKNGFKVLLNGHLDVVPANTEQFKLKIKGDRVIGRGTLDMKLSLLILLDSFTRIAPQLSVPVGLQVVSDEEIGGRLGTKLQKNLGIKSDFFLAGETTELQICDESKGVCHVRLKASASSQHSAYQWEGRSLLDEVNAFISKLRKEYPFQKSEKWATTVTIANIRTNNSVFNKSPGMVEIELDIRYVPNDSNFKNKTAVKGFLKKVAEKFTPEIVELEPAHNMQQEIGKEYLQKLSKAIAGVTHRPVKNVKKPGASDARYYAQNSTAVVFGPIGEGLHSQYEYVSKESLENYSHIIDEFLLSLG